MSEAKKTVIVVGVGITSLMTAYTLSKQGYEIRVITQGPDPRENHDAEQYGSTGNGRMGRFLTMFEGEPYMSDTLMYPDMKHAFSTPISQGGRLAKPFEQYSSAEKQRLQKRISAMTDQTKVHTLFEDYYIAHNAESLNAWDALLIHSPELFENTDITADGILRLYDNTELYNYAISLHKKYNALYETLSAHEVAERFPFYRHACEQGLIAGGIIARGRSLNIHQFSDNLIAYLQERQVEFLRDTDVTKMDIQQGVVHGLVTSKGVYHAHHYSLNPGAYAGHLLDGTSAEGLIGGVAGRWLIIPAPEGFAVPTKIHGSKREEKGIFYPVVDNNLTPFKGDDGRKYLAVGGGYVYVGDNPHTDNAEAYQIIDEENHRTIRLYLGEHYDKAKKEGTLISCDHTCVRSFTPDDAPIHVTMPTASGGVLTITAGTNTGTTTLAPYLAERTAQEMQNHI